MAEFTPGPWFEENNAIWHENGLACIAEIFEGTANDSIGPDSRDANARLIAAAPLMFSELTAAAHDLESTAKDLEWVGATKRQIAFVLKARARSARAAIAKARGK